MSDARHVLIVDDDSEVRQLFCDLVKLLGFAPTATASGMAALQQLKSSHFDLVILDMRVPDLSGLEAFKAIRQFNSSVPVVLTTGFGMDKDVQEALSMGALMCLEKPFEVTRTLKTLREIVEKESPRK
jgi:DNA-binding NtrC family response regulator